MRKSQFFSNVVRTSRVPVLLPDTLSVKQPLAWCKQVALLWKDWILSCNKQYVVACMMNNKIVADFFHAKITYCPSNHAKTYIFNFPAYPLDTTKSLLITLYTDFTQFLPHPVTPNYTTHFQVQSIMSFGRNFTNFKIICKKFTICIWSSRIVTLRPSPRLNNHLSLAFLAVTHFVTRKLAMPS